MEFPEQIRKIRTEQGLTQEQMAEKLCVTRQAVSNWENGRNLPDIEMLIRISRTFHVSLDTLILGGESDMSKMSEKLIRDGSESRRAKMNMVTVCAGAALMALGVVLFLIKGASPAYIDADGILHENFYLIPLGYLCLFAGFVSIAVSGVRGLIRRRRARREERAR